MPTYDDDDPIVQRPDETWVQPPRPVPPLPDPDADVHVVHEQERVRVLPDGSVLRETDRVEEQQSGFKRWLPWILIGVLALIVVVGAIVWFATRSDNKTVPTVTGLQVDAAVNRLQNDGFKVQISRQESTRPAGIVFSQSPTSGASARKGSTVHVVASQGPGKKVVPNAVGRSQADARDQLVQAGFSVTTAQVFSSQPTGTVVAQDPAAGTRAASGTRVRINVSKGAANVAVPNQVGTNVNDARAALAAQGFNPAVTLVSSTTAAGTVISQTPAGGSAPRGSTVQLNVSQGPPTNTTTAPPTTPDTTTTGSTTTGTDTTGTTTTP